MITLESAIKSVNAQVPKLDPIMYWKVPNGFVFMGTMGGVAVGTNYFLVTDDGEILPTDPFKSKLKDEGHEIPSNKSK